MSPSPEYLGQCIKLYREALGRNQPGNGGREVLGKFHVYVTGSLDQAVREAVPYLSNYYDIHKASDPDRGIRGGSELNKSQYPQTTTLSKSLVSGFYGVLVLGNFGNRSPL